MRDNNICYFSILMIWIIDNFVYWYEKSLLKINPVHLLSYKFYFIFVLSNSKYTALILARGGSKQIPKKNLAVVEKKTLLKRTIDVAKAAGSKF